MIFQTTHTANAFWHQRASKFSTFSSVVVDVKDIAPVFICSSNNCQAIRTLFFTVYCKLIISNDSHVQCQGSSSIQIQYIPILGQSKLTVNNRLRSLGTSARGHLKDAGFDFFLGGRPFLETFQVTWKYLMNLICFTVKTTRKCGKAEKPKWTTQIIQITWQNKGVQAGIFFLVRNIHFTNVCRQSTYNKYQFWSISNSLGHLHWILGRSASETSPSGLWWYE